MQAFGKLMAVLLIGLVVGAVFLVLVYIGVYNGHNAASNVVDQAWGDVEADLQRRYDLIPNLTSAVKAALGHEHGTLKDVNEARAKVGQLKVEIDKEGLTPELMTQFMASQNQLGSSLGRLLATVESQPTLKANENVLTFQAQLEGTENRIAVSRKRYNEAATVLNTRLGSFFGSMVNSFAGNKWQKREQFKADEGSHTAPVVSFE